MSGVTAPAPVRSGGEKFELRIEPGSEGALHLVAVAPTALNLSLTSHREDGRRILFRLDGTQVNLPADTVCSVVIKTFSCDMPEWTYSVVNVPLRINNKQCSLEFEADIYEARFFGVGFAELTVIPDFPFAGECKLPKRFEFNIPLGIRGLDLTKPVLLGKKFYFEPDMDRRFKGATLRFSAFHTVEPTRGGPPQMAPEEQRYATVEWTLDNLKPKDWRVGFAHLGDQLRLGFFETLKAEQAFDLRIEVLLEMEGELKSYLLWEKRKAFAFPRPKLTGFEFDKQAVTVKVANLDPDFRLPVELSLWRYEARALGDSYSYAAMDPVARPVLATANVTENFWRLIPQGENHAGRKHFALLRIPRSLTGTDAYVPLHSVMDFDEAQFLTFDDDELWLEPPKSHAKKAQTPPREKPQRTRKELATAVASRELTERAVRIPRIGDVWVGARDNNLLLTFKLVGDLDYWKSAQPTWFLCDTSGEQELMRLEAQPTKDNPRLHEALIPFDDPRLSGKKVRLRGRVTHPDARLWNELVASPPAFDVEYEGVPALSDLQVDFVELTDDTSNLEVRCNVRHIPNGKEGDILEVRLHEYFADMVDPIVYGAVPFQYGVAHPSGGGQCDSRGRFLARLRDATLVERIQKGKFRVEVRVLASPTATRSRVLPTINKELKGTPREIQGTVVFGGHPNVPEPFRKKVLIICEQLKMNPDHVMAVMAFETGRQFKADTPNAEGYPAYGLIQFTAINTGPSELNISLDKLRRMTELEQLDYVQKYFQMWKDRKTAVSKLDTLGDVYACVICPEAIGQPDSEVCYPRGKAGYESNKGLDRGNKGYITKADILVPMEQMLAEGQLTRK
ncbi:hypothetical protein ACLESD_16135 [Pyxidicoccus sp. 3LFB2]